MVGGRGVYKLRYVPEVTLFCNEMICPYDTDIEAAVMSLGKVHSCRAYEGDNLVCVGWVL